MQNNINTLIDLINNSGLKPTQKKLGFSCLEKITANYNIIESKYQARIKQDHKIKSDFFDWADRVVTLNYILDISELDLLELNYNYTEWIKSNLGSITKSLSFEAIKQIFFNLKMYQICYNDEMPHDMKELKRFILEPLEITEENFDEEFKKALFNYKIGDKEPEIMKVGWFKEITNKIKKV